MQLVNRFDDGTLATRSLPPFNEEKCSTYSQLYAGCSKALFKAHVEGVT